MDLMKHHGGDMVDIFDLSSRDQEIANTIGRNEVQGGSQFPQPVLDCFADICRLIRTELDLLKAMHLGKAKEFT